MIVITSTLWRWSGDGATWHFVSVAPQDSDEIRAHSLAERRGFGSVKVEAAINGIRWRTSVFPQKSGGYLLPVKAAVRRDAEVAADDPVTVELKLL